MPWIFSSQGQFQGQHRRPTKVWDPTLPKGRAKRPAQRRSTGTGAEAGASKHALRSGQFCPPRSTATTTSRLPFAVRPERTAQGSRRLRMDG